MIGNSVVGLEIGSYNTKIVLGQYKFKGLSIKDYRIFETPEGVFLPDDTLRIPAIKPALEQRINEMKCKSKNCYLSLSSRKVIVRQRELPKVKQRYMEELVNNEAEQFLPYSIEEFIVDYKVFGEVKNEEKDMFKVLIVAVPREIIQSYMNLIKECGLKLKGINVYTNCIYKYGIKNLLEKDKNIMTIDMGGEYTKTIIFRGYEYFANINSDIGGNNGTDTISQTMGIERKRAEEIKIQKGTLTLPNELTEVDDERIIISTGLKTSYSQIAGEIMRVLDFFRTRRYGDQIDKVILLGGGSNIDGIEDYLKDILGLDVIKLDYPKNLTVNNKLNLNKKEFRMLIPAIGSIIRG